MRDRLSQLIVAQAKKNPKFIVLTGDHGYALFDELRNTCPDQFINCGIAEQSMVGIAAGLCRQGYQVVVYGLAAFIPMRVLEQIKLDICFSNLPVTFLGDGAGLVYSTLGASHHCAEDISVLRSLPNISIYTPWDAGSIEGVWNDALSCTRPAYIRIPKADRPDTGPMNYGHGEVCIATHGSMVQPANEIAKKLNLACFPVLYIHPIERETIDYIGGFDKIVVIEEHSEYGGLSSILNETIKDTKIHTIALKPQFADKCGSYQYALSEHEMDDESLMRRVKEIIA